MKNIKTNKRVSKKGNKGKIKIGGEKVSFPVVMTREEVKTHWKDWFDSFMLLCTSVEMIKGINSYGDIFIIKSSSDIYNGTLLIKILKNTSKEKFDREVDVQNDFYTLTSVSRDNSSLDSLCPKVLFASSEYMLPINIGNYKKNSIVSLIAMEYMDNYMTVGNIVKSKNTTFEQFLLYAAMIIYTSIQFTLLMEMLHNDLHVGNIMINTTDEYFEGIKGKAILIDFGESKDLKIRDVNMSNEYVKSNEYDVSSFQKFVGDYIRGDYDECIKFLYSRDLSLKYTVDTLMRFERKDNSIDFVKGTERFTLIDLNNKVTELVNLSKLQHDEKGLVELYSNLTIEREKIAKKKYENSLKNDTIDLQVNQPKQLPSRWSFFSMFSRKGGKIKKNCKKTAKSKRITQKTHKYNCKNMQTK